MLTIGAHLSASKGYTAMLKQAQEIGANTFNFSQEIHVEAVQRLLTKRMLILFLSL